MQSALARAVPLFSEPGQRATGNPLAPAAWAVLPLVASGRQVGSCLITFATERAFSREDRTMYSAFAGILAQSLERARLYDIHHHRATELQRAMLPRSLPELPGVSAAARYLPSTEGMQIGGDWYDLIALPHGPGRAGDRRRAGAQRRGQRGDGPAPQRAAGVRHRRARPGGHPGQDQAGCWPSLTPTCSPPAST